MEYLRIATGYLAPCFIVASPILSYSDQALSMQRNRSSAGFSLDIPLIMLIASFFRIFYWPGARFDIALLLQSLLMVGMQFVLLKIALDHRPSPSNKGGDTGIPFAGSQKEEGLFGGQRPFQFWQWRSPKPYWQFLLYLFLTLLTLQLLLSNVPSIYPAYSVLVGYIGLGVEATLPMPQIYINSQTKSCKGFRLSVLANWLAGDAMKMFWFFTATSEIPWAFKYCGMFQASCDCFLGVQYWMYGEGTGRTEIKDHVLEEASQWGVGPGNESGAVGGGMRAPSRSLTPTRRPAPFSDNLEK